MTNASELLNPSSLFLSFAIGFLPALLWLIFWLYEDRQRPEPRSLILSTFILGMLSVLLAYFVEGFFTTPSLNISHWIGWMATVPFINMAVVEELVKFLIIFIILGRNRHFDEPVDAMIYMITIALGFASMENIMFLINSILQKDPMSMFFFTGGLRFLGSTILHTVSSALIGAGWGLAFYKKPIWKISYISVGLIGSIALHTTFNFLIILSDGQMMLPIMMIVWASVFFVLFLFELAKKVQPQV